MSEYITNTTLTKQIGNLTAIKSTEDANHIDPFMPMARLDMRKAIGDDAYDEYRAKEDSDEDRMILARAESYFALAYIIPHLNRVSSGAGIVKATGFNESRNELLSESEVQRIAAGYREEANSLLADYKLSADADDDGTEDNASAGPLNFMAI